MTRNALNKIEKALTALGIVPFICIMNSHNRGINLVVITLTIIIMPLIYAYFEEKVINNKN